MENVNDQVSCQVLETVLYVCEQKGIDIDWVLTGLPFDQDHLSKPGNFIDWSSLVSIVDRVSSQMSEQEVLELSEVSYQFPIYRVWRLIGLLRFDLMGFYLYLMGEGGAADRLYPFKVETLEVIVPLRRLKVRYTLPEQLEPCETFFRVFEGQAIGISRFLGYGPSKVKAEYKPRQVEFEIELPAETGLIPRLRRVVTYPFTWRNSVRALEETQDALIQLQKELAEGAQQLEAEKERSELIQNQLELVIRNQPVMLWALDMSLKSTYMSPSVERFIGYAVEEMQALPPFSTISEESQALALETFQEYLEKEKAGEPFLGTNALRFLQIRKDGSTFWSENYLSFLRNEQSEPIGIIGFSVDITEVIQREAREESLEQQVQSLRQREFVSQVAGGIAHDFNNSLQSITGFAEIALAEAKASSARGADKDKANNMAELQEQILRSAAGAADLTKKLLALSRQQALTRALVDIEAWLKDCMPMARSVLGSAIDLEMTVHEPASVSIDALQMERALLNLLMNARDAMDGKGRITIEVRILNAAELTFVESDGVADMADQYVEVRVQDTGCGIPETDQQRIFEPFFSSKKPDRGTGLGLAVTAGIIDQHEGFIRATSPEDGGAALHLYLPRSDQQQERETPVGRNFASQGLRVLLVDDEDLVRELCRSFLEADGAIVTEASSGQSAVDRATKDSFDLIIMDVVMLGLSGHEAARLIRQDKPDVQFLFITGYAGSQEVLADLAHERVLPKPFRKAELLSAIADVVAPATK